jgi:hypothetical protein
MPATLVILTIRTPPAGCCTCVDVSSESDGCVDVGCVPAAEGRIAAVSALAVLLSLMRVDADRIIIFSRSLVSTRVVVPSIFLLPLPALVGKSSYCHGHHCHHHR